MISKDGSTQGYGAWFSNAFCRSIACHSGTQQKPKPVMNDLLHSRLIDGIHTTSVLWHPQMSSSADGGHTVNRKRVQRLMRLMGWRHGTRPNTSLSHPEHKVYPYLLRGMPCEAQSGVEHRHNYIRLPRALPTWWRSSTVLAAVLSWRISNSMKRYSVSTA